MALPPPTTPTDLELTQTVIPSEPAPQNVDAAPPSTFPSAEPQVAEPQQATPAMGPRYALRTLCLLP